MGLEGAAEEIGDSEGVRVQNEVWVLMKERERELKHVCILSRSTTDGECVAPPTMTSRETDPPIPPPNMVLKRVVGSMSIPIP